MEEEQKRCRKGTFQAVLQWFGHAGKINDASDDVDKATSSLLFGSAWVLASSCAIHYFLQFGSPGHVNGGHICRSTTIYFEYASNTYGFSCCVECRAAYAASVALYKPVQIPMLQCVVKLLSVRFHTDRKRAASLHNAFPLCGGIHLEGLKSRLQGAMIWLLTFWYLAPLAAAVPLSVIFLPATLILFAFMAAPCITLYVAVASNGTLTRYLRITRLKQQNALSKVQRTNLRHCTVTGFQQDPMACVDLMRGFSLRSNQDEKRKTSKKVSPDESPSGGAHRCTKN